MSKQFLSELALHRGSRTFLIYNNESVDDDIGDSLTEAYADSTNNASDFFVTNAYIADTDDELEETLTTIMFEDAGALDELQCFEGLLFPASVFPIEVPVDDYDIVFVLSKIDADAELMAVAEFPIYDAELLKNYIETAYLESTAGACNFEEFDIDDYYVFVGSIKALKVGILED